MRYNSGMTWTHSPSRSKGSEWASHRSACSGASAGHAGERMASHTASTHRATGVCLHASSGGSPGRSAGWRSCHTGGSCGDLPPCEFSGASGTMRGTWNVCRSPGTGRAWIGSASCLVLLLECSSCCGLQNEVESVRGLISPWRQKKTSVKDNGHKIMKWDMFFFFLVLWYECVMNFSKFYQIISDHQQKYGEVSYQSSCLTQKMQYQTCTQTDSRWWSSYYTFVTVCHI